MKKNVAGQFVGAMVIAKADGTPVTTGTTTVSYVGDNGSYTTGSVGSGAATHKGGGYWEYAPSQGETNFDHVSFVFANTNGVNAAIQIYTSFPQTGDNYARIGAPAGASVSADVAAVKAQLVTVNADTDDIQTRLPAALVGGRMDSSVGAMANNVITAAAIAADAITDAKVAADVTIASVTGSVGSVTGNVGGNVTGSVGSVATGGITAASFAAGAINAAAIATNAIDADALATDAVTEIQSGLATSSAITALQTSVDDLPTNAELATALAPLATAASVATLTSYVDTEVAAIKAKTDNLPSDPADASDIASAFGTVNATLGTIAGYVDTEVAAIKVVTDKLNTTIELDGAVYRFTTNALEQAPTGGGTAPTAAEVADAVWDEPIADHLDAGSTGESLNGAGSAGNPWVSVIEGTLNAGDILRVLAGVAAGKTSIVETGDEQATVTFRDITDASDIVVAAMDHSERETVTVTP